jgi:hypothetical protein
MAVLGMAATTEVSAWDKFKTFMGGSVIATVAEIHSLLPDSILFGSIMLYFLTQHSPYGVFAIFMLESTLIHRLISWVAKNETGPSRIRDDPLKEISCRAGFKTASYTPKRTFQHDPYPSYGVFSLASIVGYLGSIMVKYQTTLTEMNDSWTSRPLFAFICMALVLIAFVIVRLYYCDSIGEVIVATALGLGIGIVIYFQNKELFGIESLNFLGLPYMTSKDSTGKTVYVCQRITA